ncbi:MAG: hypothetical protein JO156_08215 [Solirubrobacterales bacterium]|nr:hypothetical protein [Solirubrobacterales bacterium]
MRESVVRTLWASDGLHAARPLAFSVPPDVLGHLLHHIQPQSPQELWVMMREVSLGRVEELSL